MLARHSAGSTATLHSSTLSTNETGTFLKPTKTDVPRGASRDTSGRLVPSWYLVSFAPSADECVAQGSDFKPMRSGTSGNVAEPPPPPPSLEQGSSSDTMDS
ncbi:unnamed protein product [Arctogadus glacialis]